MARIKHPRALLAALLGLVAAIGGAVALWAHSRTYVSTDEAQVDGDISSVSSRIDGVVTDVYVADNQYVHEGDLLAELDRADYHVALSRAEANLARARAQLRSAATENDFELQIASLRAAAAQVAEARLDLGYTRIYAPVDGIVGRKSINVGNHVEPGQQLLVIVQVDHLWVTANFEKTQLDKLRVGQRARVTAYGKDFDAAVESLPGLFLRKKARLPVRLRLVSNQPGAEKLRPGMSAQPKVFIQ